MIKFNKHNIVDTKTGIKARVRYSFGQDIHGVNRVWIYEKDCARNLLKIFANARNDSDMMTDYIESSKVSFYENDEHYQVAYIWALAWEKHWEIKRIESSIKRRWLS